jgi:hypothetical protein
VIFLTELKFFQLTRATFMLLFTRPKSLVGHKQRIARQLRETLK